MKKRIFLDGKHTAVISVNEERKTVVAELETEEGTDFVYAEKFNDFSNYEKEAIKACIRYLKISLTDPPAISAAVNILAVFAIALKLAIR